MLMFGISKLTVTSSAVLLVPALALAFKPAPVKAPIVYADAQKTVEVKLTPTDGYGPAKVTVTETGQTPILWAGELDIPAKAVVSSVQKRVVLLGGRGDSGMSLGAVHIYDFSGKALAKLDLRTHLPDLEAMSKAYRKVCCPFPWIHDASLAKEDAELHINVCDKKTVVIDLKTSKLVDAKQTETAPVPLPADPSAP